MKKHTLLAGRSVRLPLWILFLLLPAQLFAFSGSFDFATTAEEGGSLTHGHVEAELWPGLGGRINFLEQKTVSGERVPGTEFSTQFNETVRREIDSLYPIRLPLGFPRSAYVGLSIVVIDEEQLATYVVVDGIGEFGTEYTNTRTTRFFSPRIGFSMGETFGAGFAAIGVRYNFNISPIYRFRMEQKMTFDTVDFGEEVYPAKSAKWSSPYLDHELSIRFAGLLRSMASHSYMFIPYTSLQLAEDGYTVVAVDDPTHLNTLRINFDLTLPFFDLLSFNIGVGNQWSFVHRSSDAVPGDQSSVTKSRLYFRIGTSFSVY